MALAAVASMTLAGCSGDDDPGEVTAEPSAAERLEQARTALVEAGTFRLDLASADLPSGGGAVIAGEGVGRLDPPAFEGTITARMAGLQADVPVIAVDGDLHVQLPYTPRYVRQSPEQLGVPDPARLFDPEQGVVNLLALTENAEYGETTRVRSEILQDFHGEVPGDAVVNLFGAGDRDSTFDATYGVLDDDTNEVRTVALTGEFYPPQVSTYTLTLSDYGLDVDITAP